MTYEDITIVEIAAGPWFVEEEELFPEGINEIMYAEGLEDEDGYLVWIYQDDELDEALDYEMCMTSGVTVYIDGDMVYWDEPDELDGEFWFAL